MADINSRVKELREALKLNQEEFGNAIGLSKSGISNIENGIRNVTEKHIKLICHEFPVSENWLRYGQGEMFVQPETLSLDEYAAKNNLTELELDIIKGYMELDSDIRKVIISHFKSIFDKHSEITATKEEDPETIINNEVESYRKELEAELKGEISSVSEDIRESSS